MDELSILRIASVISPIKSWAELMHGVRPSLAIELDCRKMNEVVFAQGDTDSAVWSKTYIRWEIIFIICSSRKMQLCLHCEKCKHWI